MLTARNLYLSASRTWQATVDLARCRSFRGVTAPPQFCSNPFTPVFSCIDLKKVWRRTKRSTASHSVSPPQPDTSVLPMPRFSPDKLRRYCQDRSDNRYYSPYRTASFTYRPPSPPSQGSHRFPYHPISTGGTREGEDSPSSYLNSFCMAKWGSGRTYRSRKSRTRQQSFSRHWSLAMPDRPRPVG
ncbi:hypothetical protein F5Y00DRAFT_12712 [Daldinia vernicosa]|uniref:uncharacterized protein n=1 Tax=Daldinia vernicosa TaxID=114800 RepID=UPI002007DEDF|nr:uncharacterized protein F5Y00DRAFT_12712 [Daldinia vernicosa]KAI0851559.1 hypothetical protein F5Y00DRAFT_12712 [Daldinia vernicosa]